MSWKDDAACRDVDPNVFFVDVGTHAEQAKRICRGCSVRRECLELALEIQPDAGIWGGLNVKTIKAIRRSDLRRSA